MIREQKRAPSEQWRAKLDEDLAKLSSKDRVAFLANHRDDMEKLGAGVEAAYAQDLLLAEHDAKPLSERESAWEKAGFDASTMAEWRMLEVIDPATAKKCRAAKLLASDLWRTIQRGSEKRTIAHWIERGKMSVAEAVRLCDPSQG